MKKTMYRLAVLSFLGIANSAFAQEQAPKDYSGKVGINTETPNATLDIKAKAIDGTKIEGLKTPQLTGDALQKMTTQLTADNDGLVVFVTSAVTTPDANTTAVTVPGYYRFNVTEYKKGMEAPETSPNGNPKLYTERTWVRMEPTGLEFVVENGKGGRRLVGADATKYGDIGQLAVDMSHQTGEKIPYTTVNNEGKTVYTYHDIITEGNAILTQIGATGDYSFVANRDNTASGQRASAFGFRAVAKGSTSFAAGHTNVAEGNQSATFGYRNYAKGQNAAAFGQANYVEGQRSFVSGQSNQVIGTNSVAFGREHNTSQEGTAAFGIKNTITSPHSVVFGEGSKVLAQNIKEHKSSVAMGTNVEIKNSPNSLAYGANTKITNSKNAFAGGAEAEGKGPTTITDGNSSIALGASVQVTGNGSVGLGAEVTVNGTNSVAIGKEARVTGNSGVAIGYGAKAEANEVAIGSTTSAVILGKLKAEAFTAGSPCTEKGRIVYNGTDFLGCTDTWVKLNN